MFSEENPDWKAKHIPCVHKDLKIHAYAGIPCLSYDTYSRRCLNTATTRLHLLEYM